LKFINFSNVFIDFFFMIEEGQKKSQPIIL